MKKYAGFIIAALAVIIGAVGFAVLPDRVVMQIAASGGANTTMGKLPAMLIPTAITAALGIAGNKTGGKYKLAAVILLAVMILTIILNLTVFA